MERDEFFEAAMAPGFPDGMTFQLQVPPTLRDGKRSFSIEGVDQIAAQIRDFLIARMYAEWQRTGKPPVEMQAAIALGWEGKSQTRLEQETSPWYALNDASATPTLLDGQSRPPRWEAP
jgi:hypothetical protein